MWGTRLALAAAGLLLGAVLHVHYRSYLRRPSRGRPLPGPPQLPLLGNMLRVARYRHNFADLILHLVKTYVRAAPAPHMPPIPLPLHCPPPSPSHPL